VRELLDDASLLDALTDTVYTKAANLASSATSAASLSKKFAAESFTLSFGGLDTFFGGLEAAIGRTRRTDPNHGPLGCSLTACLGQNTRGVTHARR
jgi:hypothetical protein